MSATDYCMKCGKVATRYADAQYLCEYCAGFKAGHAEGLQEGRDRWFNNHVQVTSAPPLADADSVDRSVAGRTL